MLSLDEARLLDRLAMGGGAPPADARPGLRQARAAGHGLAFKDFRPYQTGDDPRSIDWTVAARLDQLVVRVFRTEGRLQVHVLMDTSASMNAGTPTKRACATKVAAALCYVAVQQRDGVALATFDETIRHHVAPASGRAQIFKLFDILRSVPASGASALNQALTRYAAAVRGPGVAVVISDFFDPAGAQRGLQALLHRGLVPAIVQVVADEELGPEVDEEIALIDIEHPRGTPLVVDASVVHAYRGRMADLSDQLQAFARTHGVPWVQISSSSDFEALASLCRHTGLLGMRP